MLGLKRGTVVLCPHDPEWETEAEKAIRLLREVFGEAAVDIRHVGSTAVRGICAKPILDLAVGVKEPASVDALVPALAACGVIDRGEERPGERLFVIGSEDVRTHHIHVVLYDSVPWKKYILFRDYMNALPEKAAEYDRLKGTLAERFPDDRASYTAGKAAFIARMLEEAEHVPGSDSMDSVR